MKKFALLAIILTITLIGVSGVWAGPLGQGTVGAINPGPAQSYEDYEEGKCPQDPVEGKEHKQCGDVEGATVDNPVLVCFKIDGSYINSLIYYWNAVIGKWVGLDTFAGDFETHCAWVPASGDVSYQGQKITK